MRFSGKSITWNTLPLKVADAVIEARLMHKRLTIEEHVRWSDTDRTGMMYYGQFLRFFDIAETELFRAVGLPYAEVFDRLDIHVRVCSRRDQWANTSSAKKRA